MFPVPGEYWMLKTSSAAHRYLVIGKSVSENKPHGLKALPLRFLDDGSWLKLTPIFSLYWMLVGIPPMERGWEQPHGGHSWDKTTSSG